MSLPGKLCIGILEEDNPLKSYFRFKPVLVDQDGRYVPYEDDGHYPDEGCIRIVPDKNESYYFKARMRQNGLFCVVDLRDHPGESDKIRPNKNYRPGGEEVNGCIVYSDVVRGPAPDMIFQVLPAESAGAIVPLPHTPAVLLRQGDALLPRRHGWEVVESSGSMAVLRDGEADCPVEDMQVFDLPGFRGETLSFAILPASKVEHVAELPERPARKAEEKHPEEKHQAEEKKPSEAHDAPEERPAEPEKAPEPTPEPEPEPEPEAAEEKPWIHRDQSMLPPPVDRRLSRSEQLMAAQAGLNPRRGRSLQELIDEKWARSRMTQLGTPVSPIATGAPVANPVDAAVAALRGVWEKPQLREQLMTAMTQAEELDEMMRARRDAVLKSSINRELDALEAQRLELLGELEHLKAGGQHVRDRLKQEILKDEAKAFEAATGRTRAAQAEQKRYEQQAQDARAAARDARAALDALAGEELDRRISDVALTHRVAKRLSMLEDAPDVPPEAESLALSEFVERFTARLTAAGWRMNAFDAAGLCAALAVSPVLVLSGAPGSGKTGAARMLAEALGADAAGRLAVCPADRRPLAGDIRVKEMARFPEAPAVLVLDDANLAPVPDVMRGMGALPGPDWRLIATVQDSHSGMPVSAAALDRGFTVRLTVPDDLPWKPAEREPLGVETFARLAPPPQAEVPQTIVDRMEALRGALKQCGATISRRALDESWRWCAAMLALSGEEADADRIFDRAVAQRILPGLLAAAPGPALGCLPELLGALPECRALLEEPLPICI